MISRTFWEALVIALAGGAMFAFVNSYIEDRVGVYVESLTFEMREGEAYIIQKRNVEGEAAVIGRWSARINDANTGLSYCRGSSFWEYSTGYAEAPIRLDAWVGEEGCWEHLIPPGAEWQACVTHRWGDRRALTQCSLTYRKPD